MEGTDLHDPFWDPQKEEDIYLSIVALFCAEVAVIYLVAMEYWVSGWLWLGLSKSCITAAASNSYTKQVPNKCSPDK